MYERLRLCLVRSSTAWSTLCLTKEDEILPNSKPSQALAGFAFNESTWCTPDLEEEGSEVGGVEEKEEGEEMGV